MGVHPPCCDCEPPSYVVSPGIAVAGKGATGWANGSRVDEGISGVVATNLLGGAPLEGSEYDGIFQEIVTISAHPISRWEPPTDEEPGKWVRVGTRTIEQVITHSGPAVVPFFDDIDAEVTTTTDPETLGEGEAIMPGSDEDPELFGPAPGYLILAESSVTTGGQITRASLLSGTEELMPTEWQAYSTAASAAGLLLYPGAVAGITLNVYGDGTHPSRCGRLETRWAAMFSNSEPGPPPMLAPPPLLHLAVEFYSYDLEEGTPQTPTGSALVACPWRPSNGRFASAPDLADPDSAGWSAVGSSPTPGRLDGVDLARHFFLDLAPITG